MKLTESGADFKIEVIINGYPLSASEFKQIKISEKLHNDLPECELYIIVDQDKLKNFILIGSKIELKWNWGKTHKKYEFYQISFDLRQNRNFYDMIIKGVIYAPTYFQKSFRQESFKDKTTSELFKEIKSIKPEVRIKGKTKDKQTWIRPNYTDKSWVDYLYNYSFISEKDLVICGLNFEKKLIVDNLKNIQSQKPKIISNYDKKTVTRYFNYQFEKKTSILDYKLSPLRKVTTFDIPTHKITDYDLPNVSLFTGKSYNQLKEYYPFRALLNNMNTYEKYLYAYRFNQVFRQRLHFFEIHLDLDPLFFSQLELMDYIDFRDYNDLTKKPIETTSGKYIISKITKTFSKKGLIEYKITLSRDYFL